LFVGYAADDLVVKYMLQALAVGLAERGEKPNAFALAGIEGDERTTATAWEAKGIRPILYRTDDSHRVLHQTLHAWAQNASLGLLGRRSIVSERLNQPAPADRDEVIDQVVWALRDENGATSQFVADSEPSPPPQHWLRILDDNNLLSLGNVPLVGTVGRIDSFQPLHQVTWNLARWVSRHIGEPSVLDWALSKGGSLHANFRWLISREVPTKTGGQLRGRRRGGTPYREHSGESGFRRTAHRPTRRLHRIPARGDGRFRSA
jgi:hypothetical protein